MKIDVKFACREHGSQKSGFTLLEMLVAVSILGILAVLVSTAGTKIIARADLAKCTSNLRQIGSAMNLYIADNDGWMPGPLYIGQNVNYATDAQGDVIPGGMLVGYLADYLNLPKLGKNKTASAKLFLCPAWLKLRKKEANITGEIITGYPYQVDWTSSATSVFGNASSGRKPGKIYQVEMPATTSALVETDKKYKDAVEGDRLVSKPVHEFCRNHLFFDGHVEAVRVDGER